MNSTAEKTGKLKITTPSDMEGGLSQSYDKLAEILASTLARSAK
jgi:hypothetical protein